MTISLPSTASSLSSPLFRRCMRGDELLVLERLEEGVDPVLELRLGVVARVLEVGLDEKRRYAELAREVVAHVPLPGGEEAAGLDRVDDQRVRFPLLDVTLDLLVARGDRAVGEVLAEHLLGNGLEWPLGVVAEAPLPDAADGGVRGGHGDGAPPGEEVAEVLVVRIRWRSLDDRAEALLGERPELLRHEVLELGHGRVKELGGLLRAAQHIDRAHHVDGVEVGVEGCWMVLAQHFAASVALLRAS